MSQLAKIKGQNNHISRFPRKSKLPKENQSVQACKIAP